MATAPISVDQIFADIFHECNSVDNDALTDFETVENLVLKNDVTSEYRVVQSMANFQKLIQIMSNSNTEPESLCRDAHDIKFNAHTWSVRGNYFLLMVKPFIHVRYYDLIDKCVDFSQFLKSNCKNWNSKWERSGEYCYWPHISISYFGWRQFLLMKLNIDVGEHVPLIHHRDLGNINLFSFNPKWFLNVELSLVCKEKKLFVNGRTVFTDEHDDMFEVTMADGTKSVCKVSDQLVFSNKNFFDYIRDDINLTECKTTEKYRHIINVSLQSLRSFKKTNDLEKHVSKERFEVADVITASSENDDIAKYVDEYVDKLNDHMVNALREKDLGIDVLRNYLTDSKYVNFDYLLILIWRLIIKNNDFDFCETDIRLYLELLCEKLYPKNNTEFNVVWNRCEAYTRLLPKVFSRFCNHWTLFHNEDALESLAYYFAIHRLINLKVSETSEDENECWEYNYENVMKCGASQELLWKGFFKKIQSANACLVFNGKHYVAVKKEDELFKMTEKSSPIIMSSVKFNNWKYMYFTDEGVYNLFINDYHSFSPFILGNTLMGALTRKSEKTYLPESVITYMLNTGKIERDIYKIYHVAKVCRDVKMLKNNMSIIVAFDNCDRCKSHEQIQLNILFREIWDFSDSELIAMGMYLNEKKMCDIITNLKCDECQLKKTQKKCACYSNIQINVKALKIALMIQLLCNDIALIELAWSLIYTSPFYCRVMMDNAHNITTNALQIKRISNYSEYFQTHRSLIIDHLYTVINRIDQADRLIHQLSNFDQFMTQLQSSLDDNVDKGGDNAYDNNNNNDDDNDNNDNDDVYKIIDTQNNLNDEKKMRYAIENNKNVFVDDLCLNNDFIDKFYDQYLTILKYLKNYNIWWDKLIVSRYNDDLHSWLVRFYMRVILSKLDLKDYSHFFVKNIVQGYLYFRNFTNFNYKNSLLIMHFDASLGITCDFEKCCIYCTGEPGAGKSSNAEMMENIFVVHKRDADTYTLSKKETDEMEANKLISQLYVINEMKECNDSFFKSTADSTKSNAVCRKYQGSQKYEANFKLMIINNKPLYISNYDKGVRNRFAIINLDHVFEENLPFSGSVYSHIKTKKFPMEKSYFEGLVKPVRLFLSHILMYKRNKHDGYISYKSIVKDDPVHNHNLMCLDINNSTINALIYVMKVRVKHSAKMVEESKVEKMIELAAPYVETMIHEAMRLKRNAPSRLQQLCSDFKKRFKQYYREDIKMYCSLTMAWSKNDFNTTPPVFKS
ncbi:helicase [Buzura suppressaria nucleopolyhedrovirus]|uniref:Helicase n=1 Tax=Buzura suppressaria nuclear polyhedrosis virus TaxID=74320 RepID=W5VKH8_NPVBS|nr:helicase [Buzura suppressaria nucleopolyhedrovirus]AHH82661.1 helicase [Buzura suppressaria nucleopolyhedrovirus]